MDRGERDKGGGGGGQGVRVTRRRRVSFAFPRGEAIVSALTISDRVGGRRPIVGRHKLLMWPRGDRERPPEMAPIGEEIGRPLAAQGTYRFGNNRRLGKGIRRICRHELRPRVPPTEGWFRNSKSCGEFSFSLLSSFTPFLLLPTASAWNFFFQR